MICKQAQYPAIPVDRILGAPYGAVLRRDLSGAWERKRRGTEMADDEKPEVQENNQHLSQDNSAQSLTPDEVRDLKRSCDGEAVVEALASNSATFASKTKFAQEKYLKKKAQKHVQQVTLLRPTVMELCETYYRQSRAKVCGLRYDYLSSLLCHADVRSGARFLVLDNAAGLVTGAMATQLGGVGQIFRVFRGGCPEKGLLELDLSEAEKAAVRPVALEALHATDLSTCEWLRATQGDEVPSDPAVASRQEARLARVRQRRESVEALKAQPVDGLVIVAGDDDAELAAEVVEVGLANLAPSGRVAMFGHHLQPLAALQGTWRNSGSFVDVRLEQLFTREYQVLPARTHPHMVAEAQLCEGYILSASKVAEGDGGQEPALKRQRTA
ncbi:Trmt6 [Symbiodinium natans]|uniref:tRNA (adenine(58)-N(1))-methyltransferase non-catalytic subunit TRM6 n=1 Tax=Symbiodinium natans TaxID=878477 RepID=A0A812RZF1_9DINO|nr:Trmt6 [Symbiodinium natans]